MSSESTGRSASTQTAEEWLAYVLRTVPRLQSETVPIADAIGRTLAGEVYPVHALPIWENSAMDGYAVRSADLAPLDEGAPVHLTLVGEVPAGSPLDPPVCEGQTVRIMTGAPLPSDVDTVVPVEYTHSDRTGEAWAKEVVTIVTPVTAGSNIRAAAEDIKKGELLAAPGQHLTPARASALAAAGIAHVHTRRFPRIAVVITGSELVAPGNELARGQIPESNSVLISGLVCDAGLPAPHVVRSPDDAPSLAAELERLSLDFDVIITTGGVGPGTHDVVRIALEDEPGVRAVRVAMRPGQPQSAGKLRAGAFIFALPGNPVSAAVSFELFVRPALLTMQGRSEVHRLRVPTIAAEAWPGKAGRLQALPVAVGVEEGAFVCRPSVNPRGVSHAVGSHGGTDGYALVEPARGDITAGETVTVMLLRS